MTQLNKPPKIEHWIGGESVTSQSGRYFEDRNPLDDSPFAMVAHGNAVDVDVAVTAAHDAFLTFQHSLAKDRECLLQRAADIMEQRRDLFIDALIDEIGSPIRKARFEFNLSVGLMRAAAGMARQASGKTLPSDIEHRISMSFRAPLGVVASITPFNVPLIKGVRLSANPLALGNTVVLLPSEEAPFIAHMLARVYSDAGFPDGAFNVVNGVGAEIGDSLISHPLVRFVSFTGSTRVGRHVAALCGQHMKRVTLELGGKSPLVVMADADIAKAVVAAAHGIFTFQGQVCMGSSRVYVDRKIANTFFSKFVAAATELGMGDLRDHATVIGPIINERQRHRVRAHIEEAILGGASMLCGGTWRGNRCEPTILTDVSDKMRVSSEETFGPVVGLYVIDSLDQAISAANASGYGLSAGIFTTDLSTAMTFATRVRSGMVHINGSTLHDEPHVPFGGVGDSGFGREGTDEDIANMTEWKWLTMPQ